MKVFEFSAFAYLINILEVRVRFEADKEELNIYSLRDLLYTDEKAVKSFDELVPGTKLKAKWPNNSKFYEAVVINPLAEIKGLFCFKTFKLCFHDQIKFTQKKNLKRTLLVHKFINSSYSYIFLFIFSQN